MLEEEEHEWFIPARDLPQAISQLQDQLNLLGLGDECLLDDLVVSAFKCLFSLDKATAKFSIQKLTNP